MKKSKVLYKDEINKQGDTLAIAGIMQRKARIERQIAEGIQRIGLENHLDKTNPLIRHIVAQAPTQRDKFNLLMSLYRREIYAAEFQLLREYVAVRNAMLQNGNVTIHPIIETFIYLFYEIGYSQNAIADVTGVSQKTISLRVREMGKQVQKYGQIVEMLEDIREFDGRKWYIPMDAKTIGIYITKKQRETIKNLAENGLSIANIARKMSLSYKTVKKWA